MNAVGTPSESACVDQHVHRFHATVDDEGCVRTGTIINGNEDIESCEDDGMEENRGAKKNAE